MTPKLTAADVDELERLENAATPVFVGCTNYIDDQGVRRCTLFHRDMPGVDVVQFRGDNAKTTADHYIALRNAAPALIVAARDLPQVKDAFHSLANAVVDAGDERLTDSGHYEEWARRVIAILAEERKTHAEQLRTERANGEAMRQALSGAREALETMSRAAYFGTEAALEDSKLPVRVAMSSITEILSQPHPGATLTAENERMREENAKLRKAITDCMDNANRRWSEWGSRAVKCEEILESALATGTEVQP